MLDPLSLFCLVCVAWGAYRKFFKRRLDPYKEALWSTLFPPVVVEQPHEEPRQTTTSAGQPTQRLFETDLRLHQSPNAKPGSKTDGAAERVRWALSRLPTMVYLEDMEALPTSYSVPLGIDFNGASRYMDFNDDVLNIALYGVTKAGKDTMMMGWFITMCYYNTPEAVQFIVLDGKGHWLTPNLKGLAHMMIDPCGGFGDEGNDLIEAGLTWINTEASRRSKVIFGSGCRSREQYVAKTGEVMPMIVVLITDGIDAVQGLIEGLVVSLASKGRALGFKLVMSMQTPTRRDMRWRINLSTVISGPLMDRTQNAVAMGMKDDDILYPPSLLPPPPQRFGTFVVRLGPEQTVVQAPFISDETFDAMVEKLPVRDHLRNMLLQEQLSASARAGGGGKSNQHIRAGNDPFTFVEEAVTETSDDRDSVGGQELYDAYAKWCGSNMSDPLNPTAFGLAIKSRLNKSKSGRGKVLYLGITLAETIDA